MKDILIITYYWPPSAGSGVQRWLKFSKYLPDFGFKPNVYTPENPHYHIMDEGLLDDIHSEVKVIKRKIWEPYVYAELLSGKKRNNQGMVNPSGKKSFVSRILNYIRANFFIPDPRVHWVKPSIKFLKQYISEHNIKYIVTTGPPHSMHLIGLGLKKHFPDLKWIVDIRDPWSKFDFLKSYDSDNKVLEKHEALESLVLNESDMVLATSFAMKDLLVPFDTRKFVTITNGYDQNDFKDYRNRSTDKKIKIYHGGLINQLRNPVVLWEALDHLCAISPVLNEQLAIQLVGTIDPAIQTSLNKLNHLKSKFTIEPYKSHDQILKDYEEADILLLLVNNSDNAKANIPGKLFEYIATGKPILLMAPEGTDAAIILKGYLSSIDFQYDDPISNLKALQSFIEGSKDSIDNSDFKLNFERQKLTKSLVDIIHNLD